MMDGYSMEYWNTIADQLGLIVLRLMRAWYRIIRLCFEMFNLLLSMAWWKKKAVVQVLYKQLYFTGIQNMPWIMLLSLMVGMLSVYTIVVFARKIEDLSLISDLINQVLLQQLSPLLVGLLLLARSGVAVVTEVGYMFVRGEDVFLQSLGVTTQEYVYLPRLIAFTLSGLILTLLFAVLSVWLGGLTVITLGHLTLADYLLQLQQGGSMVVMAEMIIKGMVFPLVSCLVLLDQASLVGRNPNQLPVRATQGVLTALLLMVSMDALWLVLELAW